MKHIFILLATVLLLFSCEDVLEEEVYDAVTPENFFQTENDAIVGVIGVYDGLQNNNYWYQQFMLSEALPGSLGHFWDQNFNTLTYTDNTGGLWALWTQGYKIIGTANSMISVLENSSLEDDLKNQLLGEVKYIRAMVYFNTVRMFGHIPLVTVVPSSIQDAVTPLEGADESVFESQFLKQVDRSEVYDFIVEDLQFAEANLPEASFANGVENGRAKKGAATALLAKVYLTQAGLQYNYTSGTLDPGDDSKWALAAEKCAELITNGPYALEPNFADIFKNENENNEEIIFSIQYLESSIAGVTGEGTQAAARLGIRGADITPYAWKQAFSNKSFFDQWVDTNGESDNRFSTTYLTSYVDNSGDTINYGSGNFLRPQVWKFASDYDNPSISALGSGDYGDNTVYMRYADVLLMHSEALNEANGAPDNNTIFGINEVKQRAGQPLIELPISKEELREAIWKERKWELVYEGHYFYDCQRTGRLKDEIELNWDVSGGTVRKITLDAITDKFYILPIHFNALSSNTSLIQNYGW
ncbi:RagB/SusD family nutrient uptake outer membrane protein [Labilibaculum antarcticum]|nr:RagB/SusD family nutrient uptake outer membrane protein [Labilibaculum antarcticum]